MQKISEGKLIFIDPNYMEGMGHYQSYGSALKKICKDRRLELRHYVGVQVTDQHAIDQRLIKWFDRLSFRRTIETRNYDRKIALSRIFAARLYSVLRRELIDSKSSIITILFYTGEISLLPELTSLINREEFINKDISFFFNLFYTPNELSLKLPGGEVHLKNLRNISNIIERNDGRGRVHLTTDSHRVKNVFGRYFSRNISIIPVPLAGQVRASKCREESKSEIKLLHMGYTQSKWGYHHLASLYRDIMMGSFSPSYTIKLKVRHRITKLDSVMEEVFFTLGSADTSIENIFVSHSHESYTELIDESDLVIIPYARSEYPTQTSGSLIDAVLRGKPVIAPENTWMSDEVSRLEVGRAFESSNYGSLKGAIFEVLDQLSHFTRNAVLASKTYSEFHNPGCLIDELQRLRSESPFHSRSNFISGEPEINGDVLTLLTKNLLTNHPTTADFVYNEAMLRGMKLGWHYALDLIWIVNSLRELPKGSLIVDAGAGNGLLQYLLVALGMRVISVDFMSRPPPSNISSIAVGAGRGFNNDYVEHLRRNYEGYESKEASERVVGGAKEFMALLQSTCEPIIQYRSDIADMSLLPDESVDAVVSVSAIEHNSIDDARLAVVECLRVVKAGGSIFATTSATEEQDWFHSESRGWCLTKQTLASIFQLAAGYQENFCNFQEILYDLSEPGSELHVQLPDFYMKSKDNGMPMGVWNPKYVPVGVRKLKRSAHSLRVKEGI